MDFTQEDFNYQNKVIGEFFVQFDLAISTIPFTIPRIIYKRSHSNLELRNIETLLAGMSANQLKAIYDSLIADNYKDLPELIKANKILSTAVDKITEIRNSFAHGSYRLGWKDLNGNIDKNYFSLRHSKATKSGYEKRSWIFKLTQVQKLIDQLRIINSSYTSMNAVFHLHSQSQKLEPTMSIFLSTVPTIGKIEFIPIEELK